MNTLYIDTHSEKIEIILFKEEKLKQKKENNTIFHSTACMPLLKELLEEEKERLEEIDDIIVIIGPGSFTGVRIGVTIAKTLAYTLKIPIRTLTSLEIFLPTNKSTEYIAIPEKNGYFVGKLDDTKEKIEEYEYYKKDDYEILKKENNVLESTEIDYENLIKYAHKKEMKNPHEVNPFYVKKIEVENDKKI